MKQNEFRIYLRALEQDDYKLIHRWRHDEGYLNGVVTPKRFGSTETEKRWIETAIKKQELGKELSLAIVLKENNKMIGLEYLRNIDHINGNAYESYFLGDKKNRGKGYVSEARSLILAHAFSQLNLHKVFARILAYNEASKRSVLKFGYEHEATLREAIFKNGAYHNLEIFGITKEMFYKR